MSRHHRKLEHRRFAHLRRRALERDGYRCRACGRAGRLEADHVVPLDKGGAPYDPENLQALCRGCHIQKTRGENKRPVTPEQAAWNDLVDQLLRGTS